MTDNGALYGITDTAGGMQRSTRVAKGMAAALKAAPSKMRVVHFAAEAADGSASPTTPGVTSKNPLTTPQGYFKIELRQIRQGFSAGLRTPQPLEALLTLVGTSKRRTGTQSNSRTGQGAGKLTIHGMAVIAPGQQAAEYWATSQPNQNTTAARNTASPHGRGNVGNMQARAADGTPELAIQMAAEDQAEDEYLVHYFDIQREKTHEIPAIGETGGYQPETPCRWKA